MSSSTAPSIQRIPYSAPREDFIRAIERDGCVIIQDFTTPEVLAQAQKEVQPYLDVNEEMSTVGALNGGTRTCTRLIGRSKTVREKFSSRIRISDQDLAEHFLALTTTNYYDTTPPPTPRTRSSPSPITMGIRPGAAAQRLHRDDKNHHARHTPTKSYHYEPRRDMLFVPGCDTTREIGATRVEPDFGPDGYKGVMDAEMKAGEAFVMLGSVYHGGGRYEKESGSRTVHIMLMCSGVYRQEEIPWLSYPIEEVKTYSKLTQQRLGWKQSEPNLGWVDLKSPEFMLE
ncbi:hypothetical protein M432DRAFT_631170 [Thermoascus aurantiacus ATCC 26904]